MTTLFLSAIAALTTYWLILAIIVIFTYWVFWPLVAFIVSRPAVFTRLVRRAQRTPHFHLTGYMNRWWLFNPITTIEAQMEDGRGRVVESLLTQKIARYPWCPVSIRIHHILRADRARHPHNHPGSFRTIVLHGWYDERRDDGVYTRHAGDTAVLDHGEFHHVNEVSAGGVWTLFIMWDWRSTWGFRLDDGSVVPHQEYHNGGQP